MKSMHARSLDILALGLVAMLGIAPLAGCDEETGQTQERRSSTDEFTPLERAGTLAKKGDYKSAIIELKNALQATPDNAEARALLGDAYLQMGQPEAADKELRRALELGAAPETVTLALVRARLLQGTYEKALETLADKDATAGLPLQEVALLRGEAQLGKRDYAAAAITFDSVLAAYPNSLSALQGLAEIKFTTKAFDEARKLIDSSLAIDPESVEAWALLGKLEFEQSNLEQAEQALTKALEGAVDGSQLRGELLWRRAHARALLDQLGGAEEDLAEVKRITKGRGENPGIYFVEGLIHLRRGRGEPAETAFEQVLNIRPGDLKANFFMGRLAFFGGKYEQAADYLSKFLRARPMSREAALMLAVVKLNLGDIAGAEEALYPLLKFGGKDAEVLELLAQIRFAQGRGEEGKDYLQRAVALNPDSAALLTRTGIALLRQNDVDEAIDQLGTAKDKDPESFATHAALVGSLLENKRFEEATASAREMAENWPERAEPWTFLGIAYGLQGNFDESKKAFEKALETKPGDPSAAGNLAGIELARGNPDGAREQYERVLAFDPGHVETLIKLAKLEEAEGNLEAHAQSLERAMDANPDALQPRILLAKHYVQTGNALRGLTLLNEVREANMEQPGFLAALGETQLAAQEVVNAIHTAERLISILPREAVGQYLLARSYAVAERYEELRDQLSKAFRIDPDNPMVSALMRRLAELAPDKDAQAEIMRQFKGIRPDHPAVIDMEGQLAVKNFQPEAAVNIYRDALKREPESRRWTLRLAEAQAALGDLSAGAETLQFWVDAHADDSVARLRLANAEMRRGNEAAARVHFEELLEEIPEDPLVLNNLAILHMEEDPEKALGYAEKAVDLSRSSSTLDTLGAVLIASGKPAEAVSPLREAVELNPAASELQYQLALALVRSGDKESARPILRRLIGPEANRESREKAKVLLEELAE